MPIERDEEVEIQIKGGKRISATLPKRSDDEDFAIYEYRKKIAIKLALQEYYDSLQTGPITNPGKKDQNALDQVLQALHSHNMENLLARVNSRSTRPSHHNKYAYLRPRR